MKIWNQHSEIHWECGSEKMDAHAHWIGEDFPEFSLKDDEGNRFNLESLKGQWSVVFFYPKDGSPGCTIESCGFRDKHDDFNALGAQLIGVSSDSMNRHRRFKKKFNLQYKLLCDDSGRLAKKMRLKKTLGFMRARVTFIIDPEGVIQGTITAQFAPKKHVSHALRQLRELTTKDT